MMKTMAGRRSVAAVVALLVKRALRSVRVAEKAMAGSVALVVVAAASDSLLLLAASVAIASAAVRHLKKIESIRRMLK